MIEQSQLIALIEEFNDHFSNQQLDSAMAFFAEDSEFRDLDGSVAKGTTEIRAAFKPLFEGAFGKVAFMPKKLIVDAAKGEACFAWCCEHDLAQGAPKGLVKRVIFAILKLCYGSRFHWEGMDYLVFNEQGKIVSKRLYGKARYPQFIKGQACPLRD